jgi:pimeloyl-ACP methyl ester carboxylesterase
VIRSTVVPIAAVAAMLLSACNDVQVPTRPRTGPTQEAVPIDGAARIAGIWRDSVIGTIASNNQYGLFVPSNWNGDVVYYAHGFVAPQLPTDLPDEIAPLRDAFGSFGYAVAYSSFRENGYAVKDGIQRTKQLRGMFTSRFGNPKRGFLVGHSLGGQIVQAIAEEHGNQYDGALALCGLVGGTKMETQYIGQVRTMFDFFYPGVLPGNTTSMPVITDPNAQIVLPAMTAIQTNPNGFGALVSIDQTAVAGRNSNEMVGTVLRLLALHSLEANDLLARTHGHTLFDNSSTVYTSGIVPAPVMGAVNGGIARYTATPDAANWLEHNYQPSGQLSIPMVTLHKRHDWLVPFAQEAAYAQVVAAAGNSSKLRQRVVEDYGHCEFSGQQTLGAFLELVTWVQSGQ